jgi:hypothetical protein
MPTKLEMLHMIGADTDHGVLPILQQIINSLAHEEKISPGQPNGRYHYDYPLQDTALILEQLLLEYRHHPSLFEHNVTPESIDSAILQCQKELQSRNDFII